MSRDKIFVVGDSHATFWNGRNAVKATGVFPRVDVFHMGPVTASNLHKTNDSKANQATIRSVMRRADEPGVVIACFGEIDCRTHIIPTALSQGRSIQDVASEVADRYVQFLEAFADSAECPVIIWAPPPSSDASAHPGFPQVGSVIERNFATFHFIARLKELTTQRSNISICSLFDELIDLGGMTRPGLYYDRTHLSSRFLDRAVELVKPVLSRWGRSDLHACFERTWPIADKAVIRNIAAGLIPRPSSNPIKNARIAVDGSKATTIVATSVEQAPSVTVPLEAGYLVHRVEFYFDGPSPDPNDLLVTAVPQRAATPPILTGRMLSEGAMAFDFDKPRIILSVRLDVKRKCSLRLRGIHVLGESYLLRW